MSLDDSQREAILVYCRIAGASGALLSIKDLVELLAIDAPIGEVEEAIAMDEELQNKVILESDHVLLRSPGFDRESARTAALAEERRRKRALANVEAARVFARMLSKEATFVAVAGTSSYLSAGEGDDIDFYCITRTNTMWIFMLKSLLLSRIISVVRHPEQPFCFSFVLDEKQAVEELSRPKDAIFARDTLTARVLKGADAMCPILARATWMKWFFPALYQRRLSEVCSKGAPSPSAGKSGKKGSRVINSWLLLTVGSYVRLRAWVLNRKLTKHGRSDAVFKTRMGPGQLEYVSRRYVRIGKMYEALEKV